MHRGGRGKGGGGRGKGEGGRGKGGGGRGKGEGEGGRGEGEGGRGKGEGGRGKGGVQCYAYRRLCGAYYKVSHSEDYTTRCPTVKTTLQGAPQ